MNNKVQVLISTYNGQKYIKEQIDSILDQDYTNIDILIRDDGSTDRTVEIIKSYTSKFPNITLLSGINLGVVKSFFELIYSSSPNAEYFAFCDQDDCWEKDKLSRAINKILPYDDNLPNLYCSNVKTADSNLNNIVLRNECQIEPCFKNSLVQNIAIGCTVVVNAKMVKVIKESQPNANNIVMHDWLLFQVANAFGKVYFDKESRILYRQHNDNVVGVNVWENRMKKLKYGLKKDYLQAKEFHRMYGNILNEDDERILKSYIESFNSLLIKKISFLINSNVRLQKTKQTIFYVFRYLTTTKVI